MFVSPFDWLRMTNDTASYPAVIMKNRRRRRTSAPVAGDFSKLGIMTDKGGVHLRVRPI